VLVAAFLQCDEQFEEVRARYDDGATLLAAGRS
jgi:hypothetical protein